MPVNVRQIILADYANVSREGKLNVLGIFSKIYAQGFPAAHGQLHLIIMWDASRTEAGKRKKLEIQLVDDDGKKVLSLNGEFSVPEGRPGHAITGNYIVPFTGLRFEKAGEYAFHVLINDEDRGKVPFEIALIKDSKGEGKK